MKQFKVLVILKPFTLLLTACPQATTPPVTPEPQPPVTPDPVTFTVTISSTLVNWIAGEAYITLTSGYSVGSPVEEGTDEVTVSASTYGTTLSDEGTFLVQLKPPATSDLTTLTCGARTYPLGLLTGAVVSSVPEPTQAEEFLAGYTLGSMDSQVADAVWVYSAEALELNASCALPGSSPVATRLTLAPGWNQAILTFGETLRLESGAVPASFVWSEF